MDEENAPYDPESIRLLVIAIMEQGVEDIIKGDPGAIAWLNSRGFDHYCTWLGIDPTAAREGINAQRRAGPAKYKESDLRRVKELHDNGVSVHQAVIKVFGTYTETRRTLVNRYIKLATQPAMEAA